MSEIFFPLAMQRIIGSDSPLLVLTVKDAPRTVDVLFADTVVSQQMIREKDPRIIGVFHGCISEDALRAALKAGLKVAA